MSPQPAPTGARTGIPLDELFGQSKKPVKLDDLFGASKPPTQRTNVFDLDAYLAQQVQRSPVFDLDAHLAAHKAKPRVDVRGLVSDPRFLTFSLDERVSALHRAGADPDFVEEYRRLASSSRRTRVRLPDGSIGEFPPEMPREAIQTVLRKQFPPSGGPAESVRPIKARGPWEKYAAQGQQGGSSRRQDGDPYRDIPWEPVQQSQDPHTDIPWEPVANQTAGTRPPSPAPEAEQERPWWQKGGDFLKGFAQETPLVLGRAAAMPGEIIGGATDILAEKLGLPEDLRIKAAAARYGVDVNEGRSAPFEMIERAKRALEPAPDATTSETVGRLAARAAPQVGLGVLTGGTSIPMQSAMGGVAEGAQALSEGQPLGSAALSAGIGAAAPGAGQVVKGIVRPFAGTVNEAVQQAAKRLGLELPASALTRSSVAQYAEGAGSKMLGGQRITDRATAALEKLAEQTDEAVKRAAESASVTGQKIAQNKQALQRAWQAAKNAAYGQVKLTGIPVRPEATLAEVERILQEGSADPLLLQMAAKTREAVAFGDAASVLSHMRQLSRIRWSGGQSVAQGERALAGRLHDVLEEDLKGTLRTAAPEMVAKLEAANQLHADGVRKFLSASAKRISKLAQDGRHDLITKSLFSPQMSADDIPRLLEMAGPEALDGIRQDVLEQVIKRAAPAAGGAPTPQGIARAIRRWGAGKLQAILAPEQYRWLEDVGAVSQGFAGMKRITQGSATAGLLGSIGRLGGLATAIGTANPGWFAGQLAGEYALGKTLGSKAGQKWLTQGYAPWAPGVMRSLVRATASAPGLDQ